MFALDMIQTLAFAGLVIFLGYGLRKLIPLLARYNLPAPVIGGLRDRPHPPRGLRGRACSPSVSIRPCRRP